MRKSKHKEGDAARKWGVGWGESKARLVGNLVCVHKSISIPVMGPVMVRYNCKEQMVDSHATGQGRNNKGVKSAAAERTKEREDGCEPDTKVDITYRDEQESGVVQCALRYLKISTLKMILIHLFILFIIIYCVHPCVHVGGH